MWRSGTDPNTDQYKSASPTLRLAATLLPCTPLRPHVRSRAAHFGKGWSRAASLPAGSPCPDTGTPRSPSGKLADSLAGRAPLSRFPGLCVPACRSLSLSLALYCSLLLFIARYCSLFLLSLALYCSLLLSLALLLSLPSRPRVRVPLLALRLATKVRVAESGGQHHERGEVGAVPDRLHERPR